MALGCNFIIGLAKYYKYVTKGTDFIIGQHLVAFLHRTEFLISICPANS